MPRKKERPPKRKMTRAEWEKYAEEQYYFYRHKLKMEGEDIEITPESEWVEIIDDADTLKDLID